MTAVSFSTKKFTSRLTYGWHRAEVVGTLISIVSIWMMTIFLVKEAYSRFGKEPEVLGGRMLIVAVVGLIFNLIQITQMLCGCGGHGHAHAAGGGDDHGHGHGEAKEGEAPPQNMNMQGAILHVVGDLLSSVGVVIASVIIYFKPEWWYCDPICTFIFAVLVFSTTLGLFKKCMFIIMESTPANVDIDAVRRRIGEVVKEECEGRANKDDLCRVECKCNVHDLHIWGISSDRIALTCHVKTSRPMRVLKVTQIMLEKEFHISHATIAVEDPNDKDYDDDCENNIHD